MTYDIMWYILWCDMDVKVNKHLCMWTLDITVSYMNAHEYRR